MSGGGGSGLGINGQLRILVAEDDRAQRELLEEVFELEGYETLTAATPLEVLGQLVARPDVILLDVVGITSPELRATLRSMPDRPAILMVSGDPRLATVAEWLGADGYVAKPYDVHDLLDAVLRALAIRAGRLRRARDAGLADALMGA